MRVGLDFDNTLACYHEVFGYVARDQGLVSQDWQEGKSQIRVDLQSRLNGEEQWQRLQGQVYGKYMHRAQLFPEVANFLLRLKRCNDEVFIVSHKTEFGHYDIEKVSLRREAINWMSSKGFFDEEGLGLKREHIFFANTREEKVKKIAELKCDVFIDDLREVFEEPSFPSGTKKILFGKSEGNKIDPDLSSHSWREISRSLMGPETEGELKDWIEYLVGNTVDQISFVEGRANSQVFRVVHKKQTSAVKRYPDLAFDQRQRLYAESRACTFFKEQGIDSVMQFVKASPELNLAMYRWIDGLPVTEVDDRDVLQALGFVEQLHKARVLSPPQNIPKAAEACLSIDDLWAQIELKRVILGKVLNKFNELREFLEQEFDPAQEICIEMLAKQFPNLRTSDELPKKWWTLSPSDFGFHNALRQADGSLIWLDFEYFGWDDPVKLISDFLWHPGFYLDTQQKQIWEKGCLEIFKDDAELPLRLEYGFPVYGLRWCLILLNAFLRAETVEKRQQQLQKAQNFLSQVMIFLTNVPGRN